MRSWSARPRGRGTTRLVFQLSFVVAPLERACPVLSQHLYHLGLSKCMSDSYVLAIFVFAVQFLQCLYVSQARSISPSRPFTLVRAFCLAYARSHPDPYRTARPCLRKQTIVDTAMTT
eukprot:5828759-Pleurochrysis_carterae.AAC.4